MDDYFWLNHFMDDHHWLAKSFYGWSSLAKSFYGWFSLAKSFCGWSSLANSSYGWSSLQLTSQNLRKKKTQEEIEWGEDRGHKRKQKNRGITYLWLFFFLKRTSR
jgi:hypothetical protein